MTAAAESGTMGARTRATGGAVQVDPRLTMRYGRVDPAVVGSMATTPEDRDGPVWMVNLMRYRDRADYADGRATGLTGEQADDEYAPLDSLAAVGARILLVARVVDQPSAAGPVWHRVAVVRYPTRRSFLEMQRRDDFVAHHVHKDAGMEATVVAMVPEPAAPASGSLELPVEGVVIGDGRRCDTVGITRDGGGATMSVTSDRGEDRMVLAPLIDELGADHDRSVGR